jgi:hypothetical protein
MTKCFWEKMVSLHDSLSATSMFYLLCLTFSAGLLCGAFLVIAFLI